MGWNYRVIKRLCDRKYYFGIHEVYYNSDGDICIIAEEAIGPMGESFEKLRSEMNHMLSALGKPVLDLPDR